MVVAYRHPKKTVDVPNGKEDGNNVYVQFTYPGCNWHVTVLFHRKMVANVKGCGKIPL